MIKQLTYIFLSFGIVACGGGGAGGSSDNGTSGSQSNGNTSNSANYTVTSAGLIDSTDSSTGDTPIVGQVENGNENSLSLVEETMPDTSSAGGAEPETVVTKTVALLGSTIDYDFDVTIQGPKSFSVGSVDLTFDKDIYRQICGAMVSVQGDTAYPASVLNDTISYNVLTHLTDDVNVFSIELQVCEMGSTNFGYDGLQGEATLKTITLDDVKTLDSPPVSVGNIVVTKDETYVFTPVLIGVDYPSVSTNEVKVSFDLDEGTNTSNSAQPLQYRIEQIKFSTDAFYADYLVASKSGTTLSDSTVIDGVYTLDTAFDVDDGDELSLTSTVDMAESVSPKVVEFTYSTSADSYVEQFTVAVESD